MKSNSTRMGATLQCRETKEMNSIVKQRNLTSPSSPFKVLQPTLEEVTEISLLKMPVGDSTEIYLTNQETGETQSASFFSIMFPIQDT